MTNVLASDQAQLEQFVLLSSALTGFNTETLWGTGMAQEYFAKVQAEAGCDLGSMLLFVATDAEPDSASIATLMADTELAPYARALIKLWYVGQWQVGKPEGGTPVFTLSENSYTRALAWKTMGGHVQGARQQGYGSWARPPLDVQENGND
jgi:hypothetical protein